MRWLGLGERPHHKMNSGYTYRYDYGMYTPFRFLLMVILFLQLEKNKEVTKTDIASGEKKKSRKTIAYFSILFFFQKHKHIEEFRMKEVRFTIIDLQ